MICALVTGVQTCALPICRRACWPPTSSGSVAVRANPGWKPRRAKLDQRASGQVTRKSATSARPRPPPMAGPCTAATTGVAMANRRRALVVEGSVADAAGSVAAARDRTGGGALAGEDGSGAERALLARLHPAPAGWVGIGGPATAN